MGASRESGQGQSVLSIKILLLLFSYAVCNYWVYSSRAPHLQRYLRLCPTKTQIDTTLKKKEPKKKANFPDPIVVHF
jgi:hypothetical protein